MMDNKSIVDFILQYGMIDGAHHKQWALDQVIRKLVSEAEYNKIMEEYNNDPEYDDWDTGVAP